MLMELTLLLVIAVFATNVYLHKPVLESFLFALALAVGLTPQLLPVIISVNLAHGARKMAEQKVIVKRLASIENFGSMDVLCSDKTGTLTESTVILRSALDAEGADSSRALLFATLNATLQTGYANPIDEAIRAHGQMRYRRLSENRGSALRLYPQAIERHGRTDRAGPKRRNSASSLPKAR